MAVHSFLKLTPSLSIDGREVSFGNRLVKFLGFLSLLEIAFAATFLARVGVVTQVPSSSHSSFGGVQGWQLANRTRSELGPGLLSDGGS
jgi:hypothetical protein